MNIHVPQSYEAKAEIMNLSATKYNLMSWQSGKPLISIIQDSLLGAYLMTKGKDKLTKEQFYNITLTLYKTMGKKYVYGVYSPKRIKEIQQMLRSSGILLNCAFDFQDLNLKQ